MFKKVLVANRSEIAIRVIRALRELDIESVAVYSDSDKDSLHCLYADYAYSLEGDRASDTYMSIDKIIKIAKEAGVDAIHPGYGFLAEKPDFARAVEENGMTFIGPDSKVIELMGNKIAAKKMMLEIGVPLVPGTVDALSDHDEAIRIANEIGYPVLIKAAAGGGGMGMKVVNDADEMKAAIERVQAQASSVFKDSSVFVEKYIERSRHIEFQIIADNFGNVVHLGERECSIQRRYQKMIEESPSPALSEALRTKMGNDAVAIAKAVKYKSAGTVEFIFCDGEYYFLEMNTRIQVEHPVTEMVTGVDLVKTQIKLAAGETLPFKQEEIQFRGHAIECRVCAEDPMNNFIPSPSKIIGYRSPGGIGIRVDSGIGYNYEITSHFDSMISKLIAFGNDRNEAIARMRRALREYIIIGPKTNIPYLRAAMDSQEFKSGDLSTKFVADNPVLFEVAKDIVDGEAEYFEI